MAERQVAGKPAAGKPAGRKQAPGKPAGGNQPPGKPVGGKQASSEPAGGASEFPGQRFGLPQSGPRSVGGVARRLGALMIDWLTSLLISLAVVGEKDPTRLQYLTLAIFSAQIFLLTALTGFTLGKRLLGVRVARLDGQPVGFYRSLIRTVLFLLVVPPLVLDADLRGLHDKAAGTIVIRA